MNNTKLAILDFEYNNGIIWFVDVLAGCLWKKNIDKGTLERVVELPRISEKEQYRALCLSNGKLFIAPLFAKDLIVYDIDQDIIEHISLDGIVKEDKPNYVNMVSYGKYVFCIPMSSTRILRINTMDSSIDVYEYEGDVLKNDMGRPYFRKAGVSGSFIFMGLCNEPKVLRFDMENQIFKIIDMSSFSHDGFSACSCTKNKIILVTFDNSKAYVINQSYQLVKEYDLNDSIVFANHLVVGDNFFYIDCNGNGEGKVIDVENNTIKTFSFEVERKMKMVSHFSLNNFSLAGKTINDELWLFITNEFTLNRFSKTGQLIEKITFDVSDDDSKIVNKIQGNIFKMGFDSNEIRIEDNYMNFEAFINSIQ